MPRNAEKNAEVRESRKKQILDAALTVYIRFGYHGADMDIVAKEAGLAKGLVYYYYKSKKELFSELLTWMFTESYLFSNTLLEKSKSMNPVEQLMYYTYNIFAANKINPRMMQFAIRVPFDAYAIFGPEQWQDGAKKSDLHRKALAQIIDNGIEQGFIPKPESSSAANRFANSSANSFASSFANSFWSVFVANVFEYSKMMVGTQQPYESDLEIFRNVARFCFQGLGIEHSVWSSCLEKIVTINKHSYRE